MVFLRELPCNCLIICLVGDLINSIIPDRNIIIFLVIYFLFINYKKLVNLFTERILLKRTVCRKYSICFLIVLHISAYRQVKQSFSFLLMIKNCARVIINLSLDEIRARATK